MKKCTKCGFENEDEALFCGKCGQKMNSCPPVVKANEDKESDLQDLGFTLDEQEAPVVKKQKSMKNVVFAVVIGLAVVSGGFVAINMIHSSESKTEEKVEVVEKQKGEKADKKNAKEKLQDQREKDAEIKEESTTTFSQLTSAEEFVNILKKKGLDISNEIIYTDDLIRNEELVDVVSKAYFEDREYAGMSKSPVAHLTGGTIEICSSKEAAIARKDKVNSINNHQYEYNYIFGNVYIRLDKALSIDKVEQYEAIFDEMNDCEDTNSAYMRDNY